MKIIPYMFAAASLFMFVQTAQKGPSKTKDKKEKVRKACTDDYSCGNYDKYYCSDKKKQCFSLKKDNYECTRDGQCKGKICYRGTCTSK